MDEADGIRGPRTARARRQAFGTAVTTALLVLSLAGASGACDRRPKKKDAPVTAEPVGEIAVHAFFDRLIGQDRAGVVPGPAGGVRGGDTPGAFADGSARRGPLCDTGPLLAFLGDHANAAVTGEWVAAMAAPTADVGAYLRGLTPVVLRNDALVTNHGLKDGKARAYQALLEAGTVILADATGVPKVKCNGGNPLGPARVRPGAFEADIRPARWAERYDPALVAAFAAAAAPVAEFHLADLDTGAGLHRPAGTGGERDRPAAAPPAPPSPTAVPEAAPGLQRVTGRWTYPGGDHQSYDIADGTRWEFDLDQQVMAVTARGTFTLDITAHITSGPAPGSRIQGFCAGTVSADGHRLAFRETEARVLLEGREVPGADLGSLACGVFSAVVEDDTLVVTDPAGLSLKFTRTG